MKVVITGGAGFLGQWLIRALCERGQLTDTNGQLRRIEQIVAVDAHQGGPLHVDERVGYVAGDIAAANLVKHVLAADTDSVFHLAAVVSGAAEADFDLGQRVNVDGTRNLLEACRRQAVPPKMVFASSVAVFGGALPPVVTDDTPTTPASSYGVQKLIGELLLFDYSRKGFIDGRAVRLPTIVVRPGKPNAAASSFASGIIREPLAGVEAVCPVEADTALWVLSPARAIDALVHTHEVSQQRWRASDGGRGLNLPGLTVTVAQMLAALREVGGEEAHGRVKIEPDERIKAIVQTWPARFHTARADALGYTRDADFGAVVQAHLQFGAGR